LPRLHSQVRRAVRNGGDIQASTISKAAKLHAKSRRRRTQARKKVVKKTLKGAALEPPLLAAEKPVIDPLDAIEEFYAQASRHPLGKEDKKEEDTAEPQEKPAKVEEEASATTQSRIKQAKARMEAAHADIAGMDGSPCKASTRHATRKVSAKASSTTAFPKFYAIPNAQVTAARRRAPPLAQRKAPDFSKMKGMLTPKLDELSNMLQDSTIVDDWLSFDNPATQYHRAPRMQHYHTERPSFNRCMTERSGYKQDLWREYLSAEEAHYHEAFFHEMPMGSHLQHHHPRMQYEQYHREELHFPFPEHSHFC